MCQAGGFDADVLRRVFNFIALSVGRRSSVSNNNNNNAQGSSAGRALISSGAIPQTSLRRQSSRTSSFSRRHPNALLKTLNRAQCIRLLHLMSTTRLYSAQAFDALLSRLPAAGSAGASGVHTPPGGGGRGGKAAAEEGTGSLDPVGRDFLLGGLGSTSSSSSYLQQGGGEAAGGSSAASFGGWWSNGGSEGADGAVERSVSSREGREQKMIMKRRKDDADDGTSLGVLPGGARLVLDNQSEDLRVLKLVELSLRLELPHTYGNLTPEATRVLGRIRDTPYVGKSSLPLVYVHRERETERCSVRLPSYQAALFSSPQNECREAPR